ncbi:MAG: Clp protease N-terminal domain-containing protein [Patulibacter minatonensis]
MLFENLWKGHRAIREIVERAEAYSHQLGDDKIHAEHLLLAALDLPGGAARRAFERAGADPAAAADAVRWTHATALRKVGVEPVPEAALTDPLDISSTRTLRGQFGESGKQVFTLAAAKAKLTRTRAVDLHILDAVGDLREGTAARALRELGVAPGAIHAAVLDELAALDRAA